LEEHTIAIVSRSARAAALWCAPLAMVFIDGGHTDAHAAADFQGWVPHLAAGGLLAIHDVYADPADGGQAPHRIYQQALISGSFTDIATQGSLRVLKRTGGAQHSWGAGDLEDALEHRHDHRTDTPSVRSRQH
jgi:hypothetical protein